ncbi:putative flavin dependent monooxygenase protein [Eutypa lata UCREL1]|uniref:Putative flavin dependent monooxygenase protein n=1 Tax=Eutypa lata (strain UCR-EL1) TaxID=1287681 RepID=M7SUM1_EUTLA|nr:putative flavin dependent monooxygenase protein [Eutypa lata UCREL1]
MTSSGRVKNQVAVIGAGVSGLIVSKRLKAEGLNPIIYERNGAPGGVWNFQHDGDSPFSSAMYESLEANFPKDLMEFVDFPWKRGTSMFPTRATIEEYLNDYSADLQVEYDTEVVDVYRQSRIRPRDWKVVTKRVDQPDKGEEEKNGPQTTSRDFDFVVVATGTFDKPFVPDYPGLDTWKEVFPDRNVLIIGNSASGWDISKQLAPLASKVWVSSTRRDMVTSDPRNELVSPVRKFDAKKRTVHLENEEEEEEEGGSDERTLSNVDIIIFCTGYLYSFPFLHHMAETTRNGPRHPIWSDGYRVEGLYEHIVNIERESLMFVGLPKAGPTWLVAQAQAHVVARAVKGTLFYPYKTEMRQIEANEVARWQDDIANGKRGENERSFHNLPGSKCAEYIDRLEEWCLEADEAEENKRAAKKRKRRHNFSTPEALGVVQDD